MKELTYTEKTEHLEKLLGQYPPLGVPWALQVGGGRTGTNSLFAMVESFLKHKKTLHANLCNAHTTTDIRDLCEEVDFQDRYVYYNLHAITQNNNVSVHFPLFFWWLQHAQKVILLRREDYFLRGISIYFADILDDLTENHTAVNNYLEALYSEPIDIEHLQGRIQQYILECETLTKVVRKLVDPSQLLEVKFSDLYEYRTFWTLRDIAEFLEQDMQYMSTVKVRIYKETHYDKIKNLNEVMQGFSREDMEEQEHFIPPIYNAQEISDKSNEIADYIIETNMPPPKTSFGTMPKKIKIMRSKGESVPTKVQEAGVFYLDKIPDSARYLRTEEFSVLPDMYENIYTLDPRWDALDTETPSHLNEFFEVTEIQSNREQNGYNWICGFSVFFLKYTMGSQTEHQGRTTSEKHEQLIQGVRSLIEFPDRCPETLLRFYVSPEVWERLAEEGLLHAKGVEFYKMTYSSEDSQLGAIWRMLALFDKDFSWAIETDVPTKPVPEDDWIYARIADWDRQTFKDWLEKNTDRDWAWAGEYLFFYRNFTNEQYLFHEKHRAWNVSQFDYLSGGGIVTRPERMPSAESVIHQHLAERSLHLTYYHAGQDVWCQFPGYEYKIPLGWEGWGIDQAVWAFLKKVLPVRHIVHDQSLTHIKEIAPTLSKDHIMFRLINQLRQEGSEFVHYRTLEPIFEEK